jgi:preprotein translocase subunit SecG
MQTVVIVIHLMVVVGLIGLVLLQKSEGGGLGMGGGGGFLTSRGTSNVLSRTTAILAAVFFATSLMLSILAGMGRKPSSILPTSAPANQPARPGGAPPLGGGGGGGILDQLRGGPATPVPSPSPAPGQPAQPSAPAPAQQ